MFSRLILGCLQSHGVGDAVAAALTVTVDVAVALAVTVDVAVALALVVIRNSVYRGPSPHIP